MFAKRIPGKPTIAPTIPDITAKTSLNDHRGGGLLKKSFYLLKVHQMKNRFEHRRN